MEIKIKVYVSTNRIGSETEDEITVYIEDSATPEEMEDAKEAAAREWMHENIEWGWRE